MESQKLESLVYFAYGNKTFNQDLSNCSVKSLDSTDDIYNFDKYADAWETDHKFNVTELGGTCPE